MDISRHKCAEGIEDWSNWYFCRIRRHWMLIHKERTIVQLLLHYSNMFCT